MKTNIKHTLMEIAVIGWFFCLLTIVFSLLAMLPPMINALVVTTIVAVLYYADKRTDKKSDKTVIKS